MLLLLYYYYYYQVYKQICKCEDFLPNIPSIFSCIDLKYNAPQNQKLLAELKPHPCAQALGTWASFPMGLWEMAWGMRWKWAGPVRTEENQRTEVLGAHEHHQQDSGWPSWGTELGGVQMGWMKLSKNFLAYPQEFYSRDEMTLRGNSCVSYEIIL